MTNTWLQTILESKASIYKKWISPKRGNRQKFCMFVFFFFSAASKRLETNIRAKQKLWLTWATFISILLMVLIGAHLVCYFLPAQQKEADQRLHPISPTNHCNEAWAQGTSPPFSSYVKLHCTLLHRKMQVHSLHINKFRLWYFQLHKIFRVWKSLSSQLLTWTSFCSNL